VANLTRDLVWKVNGIWHLDRTAIEDFDNRIDAIVGLVERHRKYLIDKHIDEKLRYLQQLRKSDKSAAPSPDEEKTLKSQARKEVQRANALRLKKTKRKLTLRFRNSKAIEMARLGEAIGHLDLAEEMPVSFEQDVEGPDISLKITFDSNRNEILIDRSYHDTALTRKAFTSVDQWREEHRITGWVSAWGRIRQFPEVAFFIALIFLLVGLS
jgi:hypothetical protein